MPLLQDTRMYTCSTIQMHMVSTSFTAVAVALGANMSSFSSGLPKRLWLRLETGFPLPFSGTAAAETVAVAVVPLEGLQ